MVANEGGHGTITGTWVPEFGPVSAKYHQANLDSSEANSRRRRKNGGRTVLGKYLCPPPLKLRVPLRKQPTLLEYLDDRREATITITDPRMKLVSALEVIHQDFISVPRGLIRRPKVLLAEIRGTVLLLAEPVGQFPGPVFRPFKIIDLACVGPHGVAAAPSGAVQLRLGRRRIAHFRAAAAATGSRRGSPPPPGGGLSTTAAPRWGALLAAAARPPRRADFDLLAKIGEGQFGTVFAARARAGGRLLAVKELALTHSTRLEAVVTERLVLGLAGGHPFLVGLAAAWWARAPRYLYLAMDLAAGGDLFALMQRVRPSHGQATLYAAEALLALEHLHAHGVVYRDLKPENVLVHESGHIMLGDMGLAKILDPSIDEGLTKTFCGTESYLAPEVVGGRPYGREVDLWQYGCFVFELYCGRSPFWRPRHLRQNLQDLIMRAAYKVPASVPRVAAGLIGELLVADPAGRLGNRPQPATAAVSARRPPADGDASPSAAAGATAAVGAGGPRGGPDWRAVRRAPYFAKVGFAQLLRRGQLVRGEGEAAAGAGPAAQAAHGPGGEARLRRLLTVNFDQELTAEVPQWGKALGGGWAGCTECPTAHGGGGGGGGGGRGGRLDSRDLGSFGRLSPTSEQAAAVRAQQDQAWQEEVEWVLLGFETQLAPAAAEAKGDWGAGGGDGEEGCGGGDAVVAPAEGNPGTGRSAVSMGKKSWTLLRPRTGRGVVPSAAEDREGGYMMGPMSPLPPTTADGNASSWGRRSSQRRSSAGDAEAGEGLAY